MSEILIDSPGLLTSKFNAHLTLNILTTIQGLLLEKDTDRAFELVGSYSRILRKMLINGRPDTILRDELETIRDFLDIERTRTDNSFYYTIDVDPDLYHQVVPKSILACFVENAVKHGTRQLESGAWIHIAEKQDFAGKGPGKAARVISIRNLAPAKVNGFSEDHSTMHGNFLVNELAADCYDRTGVKITWDMHVKPVENRLIEVEVLVCIE